MKIEIISKISSDEKLFDEFSYKICDEYVLGDNISGVVSVLAINNTQRALLQPRGR